MPQQERERGILEIWRPHWVSDTMIHVEFLPLPGSYGAGVPNPQATDWSVHGYKPGRTVGGEGLASKRSFICTYSHSPSLASPVRSAVPLDSPKNLNPTVNCACEESRLCAP